MSAPSQFSVSVAEIEREENVHKEWSLSTDWLKSALSDSDATPTGKTGHVAVSLLMNGVEIVVQGKIQVELDVPCARTLEPARYALEPMLFLVLHREQAQHGSGKPQRGSRSERHPTAKQKKEQETEHLLDEGDAAIGTFSGDVVKLDSFIREQILLDLPMFPLRSDLRSADATAKRPPSRGSQPQPAIDPRLAPLQAIAEKLKVNK